MNQTGRRPRSGGRQQDQDTGVYRRFLVEKGGKFRKKVQAIKLESLISFNKFSFNLHSCTEGQVDGLERVPRLCREPRVELFHRAAELFLYLLPVFSGSTQTYNRTSLLMG